MKWNQNFSSIHPFLALLTPLTLTPFPTEEITGCINEETKGANKALRIHVLFFISCYTIWVCPSINPSESPNDFKILIKSILSSFEIRKVNYSPALTTPFRVVLLSNLFIALKVKLFTNPG